MLNVATANELTTHRESSGRRLLTALTTALLVLTFAGCSDSHDAVMNDSISTMERMNEVLESVKDADSAQAARAKLTALSEDMKSIQERMQTLGTPDSEEASALRGKHEKRMSEIGMKLGSNLMRVATNPALAGPLEEAMRGLEGASRMR